MMRSYGAMALGRQIPLALWNDIRRCPIAVGDLTFAHYRLHTVLESMPGNHHHPNGWWLVIDDEGMMRGVAVTPYDHTIRPYQNVTVRHRLERAARTVQRRWRARRLARVLRRLLGDRLNDDCCDAVAGHAVGASRAGGFFGPRRR